MKSFDSLYKDIYTITNNTQRTEHKFNSLDDTGDFSAPAYKT